MPVSFSFPPSKLKAGLLFAAKSDIRYYLNGVMFQKAPNGAGMLAVSTDGHRLAVIYHAQDVLAVPDDFQVIVPGAELAQAAKAQKYCDVSITVQDGKVALAYGATLECPAIEGKFPDWTKVVPDMSRPVTVPVCTNARGNTEFYGFNAEYLADFGKAANLLNASKSSGIRLRTHEGASAIVEISNSEFIGILMPMTMTWGGIEPESHDWMTAPEPLKVAA